MDKTLDLTKSVFEICTQNPGVIDVLKAIGFENIANPAMLNTAGRFMTIPKGAVMKGIELDKIKEEFTKRGYSIKK
jgi:hypothetical protein